MWREWAVHRLPTAGSQAEKGNRRCNRGAERESSKEKE
jgi:hypothetical protein